MTMTVLSLAIIALFHGFKAASSLSTILSCTLTAAEQNEITRWSLLSKLTLSRDSQAAAVFANKVWVVGGVSASYYTKQLKYTSMRSDVIYSNDGVTWTEALEEAPFRRRYGHSLTAFIDSKDKLERLTLLGGFSPEPAADIWVTTDGVLWKEATAEAPWTGRGYHCSVVFAGNFWVLGGSPFNNEVWFTSSILDGSWKQQVNVPWSPRAAHACAAHEVMTNATAGDPSRVEYLFLMGGWRDTSLHDVWQMNAGGFWKVLVEAAPWDARAWFSLVSFDSRTSSDVQLGPRLWVIGGGIVGNGIEKMYPFSDAWYTRDGVEWVAASSSSSGISTAEWSMVTQTNAQVCFGKWGHSIVPFFRTVTRAYYCHESCMNEAGTISLANQLIPVCNPSAHLPEIPAQHTLLINNSLITKTLYPDECGLCKTDLNARYRNSTGVPTLLLIAGNVGVQKVNDVFQSSDGMLCEREGEICSGAGVCVQGGTCRCNTGKSGAFCDSELGYTVIESTNCFPDSAMVMVSDGKTKRMEDVKVGDSVLAMDEIGNVVYSRVYYIPHESYRTLETEYISVSHEGMEQQQVQWYLESDQSALFARTIVMHVICLCLQESLQITPNHLVYYIDSGIEPKNTSFKYGPRLHHGPIASLAQKPASELQVNDVLLTFTSGLRSCPSRNTTSKILSRSSTSFANESFCEVDILNGVTFAQITKLTRVKHRSAKTVYTMTGNMFVAGILCSNFGDYYPTIPGQQMRDFIAHKLFAPHRLAFRIFPSPRTAALLRVFMDQLVLPILRWLCLLIR
ncbi:Kelch-type beta propeller [Plasmopara halstedii]|uniref:Kelch-type beta propeller n=1 Tax=Plasmopara halstedii TaxID=4781 RepID=A0A0P1B1I1_PLAHL|nr:Kelch-type beta propeller [Plasmopara halstedii]CEG48548.1 Kelch-type beta propeller [Plasmopara halstedii]|eukprot:XP_024584917.1 Kelch-type beta propeller [Plasmopara halstedii]